MRYFIIKFKEAILRIFYTIIWFEPIWFFLNREGRRIFFQERLKFGPLEKRIASDLKRDGIAITHISELFPGKNFLPELQKFSYEARSKAEVSRKKKFLLDLWGSNPIIDLDEPFVKLSLETLVLNIVSKYLAVCPKFYYYLLNVALPVPEGERAVQSQRWHRDPEDKKMCKMFIYLNDVDEETGPFFYVKGSQYGGKWRYFYPQAPPHGVYPPEGALENTIPQSEIFTAVGRAGTIIFCDTSGLHKGGYAKARERIMFTAGFITKASRWKAQYRYPEDFFQQISKKSQLLKYAVKP